jgi:hypothetical protein
MFEMMKNGASSALPSRSAFFCVYEGIPPTHLRHEINITETVRHADHLGYNEEYSMKHCPEMLLLSVWKCCSSLKGKSLTCQIEGFFPWHMKN